MASGASNPSTHVTIPATKRGLGATGVTILDAKTLSYVPGSWRSQVVIYIILLNADFFQFLNFGVRYQSFAEKCTAPTFDLALHCARMLLTFLGVSFGASSSVIPYPA